MRFRSVAWVYLAAMIVCICGVADAQIDDPYEMRIFKRSNYTDPYIDWLGSAPRPSNIYWGPLPFGNPNDPFSQAQLIADNENGGVSIYDPTFQRKGFQIPNNTIWPTVKTSYVLMGSAGGPQTCGYGGSLGMSDFYEDGPGNGTERSGGGGDMCNGIGRDARSIGKCAPEFQEPELDQHGNYWNLENDDIGYPATGHRCRVILLTLSAMWCPPCQAEAETAEALYQEYRDPDGDGVDDFIIMEGLIEDENRGGGRITQADALRWAEDYGWQSGDLTFPVLVDQNRSVWNVFQEQNSLPTNVIIGADFVVDDRFAGWSESRARDVIETNLCEIMPTGTVVGSRVCP